jgi:hypothetical protein
VIKVEIVGIVTDNGINSHISNACAALEKDLAPQTETTGNAT